MKLLPPTPFPVLSQKKKNFTRVIQRKSVLVNVKSSNNISFIKISKVREIMLPSGETNENATLILPIVEDLSISNWKIYHIYSYIYSKYIYIFRFSGSINIYRIVFE